MTEREIFVAALHQTGESQRRAFLDRACGADPELRGGVEALLAEHERLGTFLERPAVAAPDAADTGPPEDPTMTVSAAPASLEAAGGRIGPYKLLEVIGEGGMGTVWMADQVEPIRRRVAVKVVKAGMDSRQVLARFEAERQALALMDHPNIARVLDAGTTPAGRPYFVMELVRGVPLTRFCDDRNFAVADRLRVFQQVCHAVQHAHQKGVIHRDLKPTNVLVESHEGRPVPKVIDFGLAKAVGAAPLTDRSLFTHFGEVLGTPLYMAPEQAEFGALDVDTRADVYVLGVILYELLTGTTPIERGRLASAAWDEIRRAIKEEEPPTPSARLNSSEGRASIAALRQTEPGRLGRFVRGDLDWVVMKALSKERDRRYESAGAFAADVGRFLNHEPVSAGPLTAGYRLRRFVRRHRPQVIAVSLVLGALVAGMVGTTLGLIRADAARKGAQVAQRAEAHQKRAAVEKEAEAEAVVKFFEDKVFAAARPKGQGGGLGGDVTLRDAIAASLPALAAGFADQPLVEARLRTTLGNTFYYLGDPRMAEQHERARAIYAERLGPDHPDTLTSMGHLATSYAILGRPAEALSLNETALAANRRTLPADHPDTLQIMSNLANNLGDLRRHADASKLHEEILAARRRTRAYASNCEALFVKFPWISLAEGIQSRSSASYGRTTLETRSDNFAEMPCFQSVASRNRCVSPGRRTLGLDHPDTLWSMSSLAYCHDALGRHADALRLREDVLAARRRTLPADHPDTLSGARDLAISYGAQGRHADALRLRQQVLATRRRVLPPDHPHTLWNMHDLADSYIALGRHADALPVNEAALAARERTLGPDHPDTLWSMAYVARCLVALGRGTEAVPIIDACVRRAAGRAIDPVIVTSVMDQRLRYFADRKDAAGCRATAEMWEKLGRTDPGSLYHASNVWARASDVQARAAGADAGRLAQADADRAMEWLTKAVAAGYKDRGHMEKDSDLNALRGRADFQALLASLPAAAKP